MKQLKRVSPNKKFCKFANKLRGLRLELQYSQQQMADIMGVSRIMYNRWERAISRPNDNHIKTLSIIFNIEPIELMKELFNYENQENLY